MTIWIDPQGRRWTNIVPLGVRVVAGPPTYQVTPAFRPDIVPGRNARTLAEVWRLVAPRSPYAGKGK